MDPVRRLAGRRLGGWRRRCLGGAALRWVIALATTAASGPGEAWAQARAEQRPASQALRTDRAAPHWDLALTVDVLDVAVADVWSATGEFAPCRVLAVRGAAGYLGTRHAQVGGALVGGGARVRPLGRGVDGPFLGVALDVHWRGGRAAPHASAELGWTVVWRGLVVGAGASLAWRLSGPEPTAGGVAGESGAADSPGRTEPGTWSVLGGALRLGVHVGWAWR
jgi:hypothetical protein